MTIQYTGSYDEAYYGGSAISTKVPSAFPIAIGGHPYMVDTTFAPFRRSFEHKSIVSTRSARDYSNIPGIESINTQGLWRRIQQSWHLGAGQVYFDRQKSSPDRFNTSKGINPWQMWQLTLQPDTTLQRSTGNTNLQCVTVGKYIYIIDGANILFTNSLSGTVVWTTLTGIPTNAPTSICTDGYNIWTAHGASGVYVTTAGAANTISYNALVCTILGYSGDRLMAGNGAALYNIISSGAAPTALFTHPNTDWVWTQITEGTGQIYCAGNSGSHSGIYRIAILTDGSSLAAPTSAVTLPKGEIVYSVYGYAGFVMIGTSLGVHFADYASKANPSANAGDLILGAVLPYNPTFATQPVRCFMGQFSYVWFGYENYDTTSTGLGRMNLSTFIDPLTPSYASDLMATTQGTVTSIAILGGVICFVVDGVGLYVQSPNLVASGNITSGNITFGIPDDKTAMILDVRHVEPLVGSHAAYISVDGGANTLVGQHNSSSIEGAFNLQYIKGVDFELQHVLTSNGTTGGPTITQHILKALPNVVSGTTYSPVLILASEGIDLNGSQYACDGNAEIAYLESLRLSQEVVMYQVGEMTYPVVVDIIAYQPSIFAKDRKGYRAVAMVTLKSLDG